MMKGIRIYPDTEKAQPFMAFPADTLCYGKDADGLWWFKHPDSHAGVLSDHSIVEHEDGTITVKPSIIIPRRRAVGLEQPSIHGFLTKGEWRDC